MEGRINDGRKKWTMEGRNGQWRKMDDEGRNEQWKANMDNMDDGEVKGIWKEEMNQGRRK